MHAPYSPCCIGRLPCFGSHHNSAGDAISSSFQYVRRKPKLATSSWGWTGNGKPRPVEPTLSLSGVGRNYSEKVTTESMSMIASQEAGLPFPVHPHMLRHACGFYLANKGVDTRSIQHYLGHRNIQHTVRYTELAPHRFDGFWDD